MATERRINWSYLISTATVGKYECEITHSPHSVRRHRWHWHVHGTGSESGFSRWGDVASQDAARRAVRAALAQRGIDLVWGEVSP